MKDNKNHNAIMVISKNGEALMPTKRYGKVRHMLKNKEAKIIKRDPFLVIQLLIDSPSFVQPIKGGMDIGETIGLSIVSGNKELISAQLQTRSKSIVSGLKERSQYRGTRRSRIRHRKVRFENRGNSKRTCKHCGGNPVSGKDFCRKCLRDVDGIHQMYKDDNRKFNQKRLAPSLKHIVNTHFNIKNIFNYYLPMVDKDWIIEKTKFDIQKIEKVDISGVAYQQGDMFGFTNVREFVIDRDNHKCQNPNCLGNSKILVIHHIKYRSQGGTDKPSNLVTLCSDCHISSNHQPGSFLWDWNNGNIPLSIRKQQAKDYSAATKMNVLASAFNDNKQVSFTYGSDTKRKRQLLNLEKTHANDAFAICVGEENFNIETDANGKKTLILKKNTSFEKVTEPLILKQTNGRENGRRCLEQIFFPKFIDSRDGEIKTSNELTRVMNKRTLVDNNRCYRLYRCDSKGKLLPKNKNRVYGKDGKLFNNNISIRNGRSLFPNNSIVLFHGVNGKDLILESGGMTGNNIWIKGIKGKKLATKKYKAHILCNRRGIIKENIKNI